MKRGQAKRWLTEKLKFQRKLTIGALAAMAGMGLVAWAFELGIVVLILWFGFYCSWTMAVLIGGGFLGALQMLILRGLQKELGDETVAGDDTVQSFVVAQPLSVVWTYALGQMETDMTGIERLLRLCCLPQRLTAAALFTKQRLAQVEAINAAQAGRVISFLRGESGKVALSELLANVELTNPIAALRDLSLIDGVMFLVRDQPGISLAPRLNEEIDAWMLQERDRRQRDAEDQ